MSLDDLRRRHPLLGFAVYAMEPGGRVTFEVHEGGEVYAFHGKTVADAVEQAFPPPKPKPEPAPPASVLD